MLCRWLSPRARASGGVRTCVRDRVGLAVHPVSPLPGDGSLPLVRLHAAELDHVALGDALGVCLLFAGAEPASYDRAATRWLGRFCVEAPIGLADAQLAAAALDAVGRGGEEGAAALLALCGRVGVRDAPPWLDRWLERPAHRDGAGHDIEPGP